MKPGLPDKKRVIRWQALKLILPNERKKERANVCPIDEIILKRGPVETSPRELLKELNQNLYYTLRIKVVPNTRKVSTDH